MTLLDEIKDGITYVTDIEGQSLRLVFQNITTYMEDSNGRVCSSYAQLITCKDCKHYELDGMYKGCCVLRLHTVSGYDPYEDGYYENDEGMYDMPEDGFCSNAERIEKC